ncbi:hypothetical protein K435DRAFT_799441 [Dendrothele bispora CBS 962.96]|uniref:Uncharacterized protein n=1 Tax=Dendrothele bispora (strain CBS 962.96) TaxID=1314807 RepID=A0A4S8LWA6_DENBC|nr:hypothetical protein K435DRAFT_799441 [Dendrothele bispora CBS 962.96]
MADSIMFWWERNQSEAQSVAQNSEFVWIREGESVVKEISRSLEAVDHCTTTPSHETNDATISARDLNDVTPLPQAPEGPSDAPEVEDHDKGLDTASFSSVSRELGWTNLLPEELKKKRAWFKARCEKISEWFRVEYRGVLTAKSSFAIIDRVFSEPRAERKPLRVADHLVFMDLFYDMYIKAEAEKEIREKEEEYEKWKKGGCQGPEHKPPVQVAIRSSVARRILSQQSEEFQADIKRQAEERFERELKVWKMKDEEIVKNTPQDYAKELSRWGPEVAKFNNAVAEANNMIAITVLVGPNPFKNGQIDSFWSYAGPTYIGLRWPQEDRNAYEAVKKSLVGFGKKVFGVADRAARALPATGPQVTPCGWNDADDLNPNSNSNPTPLSGNVNEPSSARNSTSKSRRPGPGRNSQNMNAPENRSTRIKPRPKGSKKATEVSIGGAQGSSISVVDPTPSSSGPLGDSTPITAANVNSIRAPSAAPSLLSSPAISDEPLGDTTPMPLGDLISGTSTIPLAATTAPSVPPVQSPVSPSISVNTTPAPLGDLISSNTTTPLDDASAVPSAAPFVPPAQSPVTMAVSLPTSPIVPQTGNNDADTAIDNGSPPGPVLNPVHTSIDAVATSPSIPDTRMTQKEEPTVWTHPDMDRFWPEMRMYLSEWITEIREKGWENEDWVQVLEDLLEVFIEYEGDFHYTEDNGDICSKWQLPLFKQWVKVGRPAILRIRPKRGQTDEELTEKVVSGLSHWWDDVVPVREPGEKEDWAPLDCVSGRNGAWKLICFMVFVAFLICGGDVEMDARGTCLAAWIGLAGHMKDTLIEVIKWGCQPPRKRKATTLPDDEPTSKRVTRLQAKQDRG